MGEQYIIQRVVNKRFLPEAHPHVMRELNYDLSMKLGNLLELDKIYNLKISRGAQDISWDNMVFYVKVEFTTVKFWGESYLRPQKDVIFVDTPHRFVINDYFRTTKPHIIFVRLFWLVASMLYERWNNHIERVDITKSDFGKWNGEGVEGGL